MQTASPADYKGKKVQLSAWMRTEDANDGGAHLWLRVDGQQSGTPLQFDNMTGRAPTGTTDWQLYSVVLDVPSDAKRLAYGVFVSGRGTMWVSGTKLEAVGPEVASTNLLGKPAPESGQPTNLSFSP